MANGIGIINGFDVSNQSPIDKRWGPYSGATLNDCIAAITNSGSATYIPINYRYNGLTVLFKIGTSPVVEYWFKDGITDDKLVPKLDFIPGLGLIQTINANGVITIDHNVLNGPSGLTASNSGATVVQGVDIILDKYGHISSGTISSINLDDRYYTETEVNSMFDLIHQSNTNRIHRADIVWDDDWIYIPYGKNVNFNKEITNITLKANFDYGTVALDPIVRYPSSIIPEVVNKSLGFYVKDLNNRISQNIDFEFIEISFSVLALTDSSFRYDTKKMVHGENVVLNESYGNGYHSNAVTATFLAICPELLTYGNQVVQTVYDPVTDYSSIGANYQPTYFDVHDANMLLRPYAYGARAEEVGYNPGIIEIGSHRDNTFSRYDLTANSTTFLENTIAVGARVNDTTTQAGTSYGYGIEFFEDIENLDNDYPNKTVDWALAEVLVSSDGLTMSSTVHPNFTTLTNVGALLTIRYTADPNTWESATVLSIESSSSLTLSTAVTPISSSGIYVWNKITAAGVWGYHQAQSAATPIVGAKLKKIRLLTNASWKLVRQAARLTATNSTYANGVWTTNWDMYRGFGKVQPDLAIQWIKDNYSENNTYLSDLADSLEATHGLNAFLKLGNLYPNSPVSKQMLADNYFTKEQSNTLFFSTSGGTISGSASDSDVLLKLNNGAGTTVSSFDALGNANFNGKISITNNGSVDTSIKREGAGLLSIYNGAANDEYRDIKVRNIYSDNVALQDGTVLYHSKPWFIPNSNQTITVSANGLSVTITNPVGNFQFLSTMVKAKLTINGTSRIIGSVASSSVIGLSSAFPSSMWGQSYPYTTWNVTSRSYQAYDSNNLWSNVYYDYTGGVTIYTDSNNNYIVNSTYNIFRNGEFNRIGLTNGGYFGLAMGSRIVATDSYGSGYQNTPDIGLIREKAGMWSIYDGVTSTNYRDLKLRNLYADNVALQDGTILYHIAAWFTPQSGQSITISSDGLTATLSNPVSNYHFTSGMVGAKLTVNGVGRIISGYTSTSVVTLATAYLPSMFSQVYTYDKWSVNSRFLRTSTQTEVNANGNNFRVYSSNGKEILTDGYGRFYFGEAISDGQNTFNFAPASYPYAINVGGTRRIGFYYNKTGGNDLANLSTSLYTASNGYLQIDNGNLNSRAGLLTSNQKIGTFYMSQLQVATTGSSETQITIESTANFPNTGTVLIGDVTSINYTGKTSTTLTFASTTIPSYAIGTSVIVTSSGDYVDINSSGVKLLGAANKIIPGVDSTTAIQITKADGTTNILNVDTTNSVLTVSGGVVANKLTLATGADLMQQTNMVGAGTTSLVASGSTTNVDAVFFDYVVKYNTNLRAGTVVSVKDGNGNVEFNDTSTVSVGNTTTISFTVDVSGGAWRLLATSTSDTWTIKVMVRTL